MAVQKATALVDISSSTTVSEAVGTNGLRLVGVITPATINSTALTFQGSVDDSTYVPIHAVGGGAYTVTVAASRFTAVDPAQFGVNYLKVVCGSAELADRNITLVFDAGA